jgi:hypothetical protein
MTRWASLLAAVTYLSTILVGVHLTGRASGQTRVVTPKNLTMPRVHYERLLPGQVAAFRLNGPRAALRKVTTDGVDPRGNVQILEGTGDHCEVGTRIRLVLRAWDHFESEDNPIPITQGAALCARLIGGDGVTGVYVRYTERVPLPNPFEPQVR